MRATRRFFPASASFVVGSLSILLASCGGGGGEQEARITRKDADLGTLISLLPQDEESKADFSVYVDFSATMSRGIRDGAYQGALKFAVENRGSGGIFRIGSNEAVSAIDGDATEIANTVFNTASYTENLTIVKPSLSQIISSNQAAAIFTDFSIDEGVVEKDFDGVTTSYIRGPRYSEEFKTWFQKGNTVRVYYKNIGTPIYAVLMIPKGQPDAFANLERDYLNGGFGVQELNPNLFELEFALNEEYLLDYERLSNKSQNKIDPAGMLMAFTGWSKNYVEKYKSSKEPLLRGIQVMDAQNIAHENLDLSVNEVSKDGKALVLKPTNENTWFSVLSDSTGYSLEMDRKLRPIEFNQDRILYLDFYSKPQPVLESEFDALFKTLDYPLKVKGKSINNNCLSASLVKGYRDYLESQRTSNGYHLGGVFIYFGH